MMRLVLLALLCLQARAETVTTVSPSCDEGSGSCLDLSSALEGLQSNTTLALLEGIHTVRNVAMVLDAYNIRIIGNKFDPASVIITCDPNVGLVFANITNLEISGVLIERCGLNDQLDNSIEMFSEFSGRYIKQIIVFRPNTSVALLIGDCFNLTMENAILRNNFGFGMVGKNIVGKSRLSGLKVLSNFPSVCNVSLSNTAGTGSGGGILLSYEDYITKEDNEFVDNTTLEIINSVFADNYICTANSFITQYNQLSRSISTVDLFQGSYTIDGSGGLTVDYSHSEYSVNASIISCSFRNNSGVGTGSALNIVQFESTDNSHVLVKNCQFYNNGGALSERYGRLDSFGALLAIMFLPFPSNLINSETAAVFIQQQPSTIEVTNCRFRNNRALSGGAAGVFSLGPAVGFVQDEMYFRNCSFTGNTAAYGPAIFVTEISYSAFEPGLEVFFENINVSKNSRIEAFVNLQSQTGAVDINYLNVYFNGTNNFWNNSVTALRAYSGIITLSNDTIFHNNTGVNGGGLHLDTESYLILQKPANIYFIGNTGVLAGGAIFVNFQTVRNSPYDCFLFFDKIDVFCNLVGTCTLPRDIRIVFKNNTAPLGSAIFGSAFLTCPWNNGSFDYTPGVTPENFAYVDTLLTQLEPYISFSPPLTVTNTMNTVATSIVRNPNFTQDTVKSGGNLEVMPGQEFLVQLNAYDNVFHPVPLTVFSQLSQTEGDRSDKSHAEIGATDRYLIDGNPNFTNVPIRVFGNTDAAFNVTITSNEANAQIQVPVLLKRCTTGYNFDNLMQKCVCEVEGVIGNARCLNNGSIEHPVDIWIGQDEIGTYIMHDCIFDYCYAGITSVNLDQPEQQCQNNRSGILCGQCIEGYSRIFGSTACSYCSNIYLLWIIFFGIVGILLFIVIAVVNVTTADGYINGFIFYGNVISIYIQDLIPLSNPGGGIVTISYWYLVIIAFMDLDFGVQTCFYDGMNELGRVALELVFPVYLVVILLTITILARYGKKNILSKVNFIRVFATLLLLSYSSVVQTCIDILGFVEITTPSKSLLRWRADPNVLYFQNLHGFLCVISILLLLILIPFPLILLFPNLALRLRFLKKLKPLIDAFCGPLANHGRFWVGFRLYVRLIIFCIATLVPEDIRLVVIVPVILLVVFIQSANKPFSNLMRNLVDMSLMVNLVIFAIVSVYLQLKQSQTNQLNLDVANGFIIVFTIELIALIVYNIIVAIPPCRRFCERLGKKLKPMSIDVMHKAKKTLIKKFGIAATDGGQPNAALVSGGQRQERVQEQAMTHTSVRIGHNFYTTNRFAGTDYSRYRESFLELAPDHDDSNEQ